MPKIPMKQPFVQQKPVWSRKAIKVLTGKTEKDIIETLIADVYGTVAVHPNVDNPRFGYTVTAIACGRWLVRGWLKEEAMRLAEFLHQHGSSWLAIPHAYNCMQAAPPWFRPWIHQCRHKFKVVDHRPYQVRYKEEHDAKD